MKKMNIKMNIKHIGSALLLTFVLGCSKDILDEMPPHLITTETLYTNMAGFEAGLNGVYATVREERDQIGDIDMKGNMFMTATDNLTSNHPITDLFDFITWRWGDANNPLNRGFSERWIWLYSIINATNTIINHAESRTDIDWYGGSGTEQQNKNRVMAEARALRALQYRHLTFAWGDVPLNLTESLGSNIRTDWERAPVAEVRRQIITDLLFAQEHIPVEPHLKGRLTKGAVQHYLAEMYLTIGKPDSALHWADRVINTPEYKLVTQRYGVRANQPGVPIMDMFYEGNENRDQGNTEALWVFQFGQNIVGGGSSIFRRWHTGRFSDWVVGGVRALVDTYERGGRGRSRQSLTKWALELYEPQDDRGSNFAIRKFFILNDEVANAPYPADRLPPGYAYGDTLWLVWNQDLSPTYNRRANWPFSRKAEGTDPHNPGVSAQWNDQVYLRLADTYLLKAEAEYLLGRAQDAANTINIIRRRSNAIEITAADVDMDFILDERSRELILEEHRRWTLLRTGKWLERTQKYNNNGGQLITARDTIFPVPQIVIDANLTKIMAQNPGY
jgi:starch-binding outer membrane protein, SusD/RagB family